MRIGAMNHPAHNVISEISWIAKNGFDFVDLTYEPPCARKMKEAPIKNKLKEFNLGVIGHTNPTLPAIYPVQSIREASLHELRDSVNFFALVGAEKMTIHPYYYGTHQTKEDKIQANIFVLKELSRYCKKIGIKLMLENYLAPFDKPETFQRIIEQVPDLYIHLDVGHCNIENYPESLVFDFFNTFKDRILHLHMHDNEGVEDEHLPLGCGDMNWQKIIKIIKNSGFDQTITLEIFSSDKDYLVISKEKLTKMWNFA